MTKYYWEEVNAGLYRYVREEDLSEWALSVKPLGEVKLNPTTCLWEPVAYQRPEVIHKCSPLLQVAQASVEHVVHKMPWHVVGEDGGNLFVRGMKELKSR